ncbi:terminase small subunit [Xenorhabdus sp. Flor]|uniref:terminase small subunit n=1 Tax=Xenorhabdus cabanillasii TaxID=351673 RepID=UPI0019B71F1A|nr:terminase small subunit [Xenorhabdus sp. Flor]MBD2816333.1 terminase small subunit [Xenorhabdus sp. Flor]
MAKPDWGVLQHQFLAEHAKTGVSPKEWCEAQGLNYITARRYIKKPTAQKIVRKTAQTEKTSDIAQNEKVKIAQNEDQEKPGSLRPQHESFAQNIVQGMSQKDAAICAGYAPNNAESQSTTLIRRPDVRRRIKELRQEAALLVTFNAKDLADLSYQAAKEAAESGKFGQVAPNIKNAAQLTGIDMSSSKTEVNVDLAGLSYGKVCIVTPATCPPEVWAAHMDKLRMGKVTAQQ